MKQSENTILNEQCWENLKISNDFIFAKVMQNPKLCKGMLERLLNIQIDHIEYPEEQKIISIAKDSKGVRIEVYLNAEEGAIYNIELQTTNSKNLPKRTRIIDLNTIEKWASYCELQSFAIFICTFDAFGKDLWKYTFKNICKDDPDLSLNDGTTKIFFNTTGTKGNISQEAKSILRFIENNTTEDDFTEKLAQEVKRVKENKEWKIEYMTLLEGEIQGTVKTYEESGLSFTETVEHIARKFGFSLQEAEETVSKHWD
ncbi:MAG: Rpn family recombination-promoting nuclease/putative transposase [Lachnospiraceae bacterium]